MFENKARTLLKNAGITLGGSAPYDITVHDKRAYQQVILKGTLGLGDSYSYGWWDCERIDEFIYRMLKTEQASIHGPLELIQFVRDKLINTQVGRRAFEVGEQHYDLGNAMYAHMLGESMGYSSGYYQTGDETLTEAQYAKFDRLCQSLKLKPGMRVLEIGAGWGTFARHAAKEYGVSVVGLTVSKEQMKFAQERCVGLPVEFLLLDYQKLPLRYDGTFDRVVSIEMIEAVGKKNFKTYFKTIERVLAPDGLVGIQAIMGAGKPDSFISTRIFPNGVLPSLKDIGAHTKDTLQLKSWESFGKDYERTLLEWHAAFEKAWPEISKETTLSGELRYTEKFHRMWRFYLLTCAGLFRSGTIDVAQMILVKPKGLSVLK